MTLLVDLIHQTKWLPNRDLNSELIELEFRPSTSNFDWGLFVWQFDLNDTMIMIDIGMINEYI